MLANKTFCLWTKVHRTFFRERGGIAVDHVSFRFWISGVIPEIFLWTTVYSPMCCVAEGVSSVSLRLSLRSADRRFCILLLAYSAGHPTPEQGHRRVTAGSHASHSTRVIQVQEAESASATVDTSAIYNMKTGLHGEGVEHGNRSQVLNSC